MGTTTEAVQLKSDKSIEKMTGKGSNYGGEKAWGTRA
jgi:hypothetical protein